MRARAAVVHVAHDQPPAVLALHQRECELAGVGEGQIVGVFADDVSKRAVSRPRRGAEVQRTARAVVVLFDIHVAEHRRIAVREHEAVLGKQSRDGAGILGAPSGFIFAQDSLEGGGQRGVATGRRPARHADDFARRAGAAERDKHDHCEHEEQRHERAATVRER